MNRTARYAALVFAIAALFFLYSAVEPRLTGGGVEIQPLLLALAAALGSYWCWKAS